MEFTDTEKNQIRVFLGFGLYFHDLNPRLESQIDRVGNDTSAATLVRAVLAGIVAADTKLAQVLKQAGMKSAQTGTNKVEWYAKQTGSSPIIDARKNGRMWCGRLSIFMATPMVGDYFSEGGYQGDAWSNASFQYGGLGSAELPLG